MASIGGAKRFIDRFVILSQLEANVHAAAAEAGQVPRDWNIKNKLLLSMNENHVFFFWKLFELNLRKFISDRKLLIIFLINEC